MNRYLLFSILTSVGLVLAACASSSVIRVESVPSGATVLLKDKEVGATPLVLKASEYRDEFKMAFVEIKMKAKGYEPASFVAKTEGIQTISINLAPFSEKYFSSVLMSNYQGDTNKLIRDLLSIQGLVLTRNYPQAEKALEEFIAKYPNVAAPYVLKANIEISKKNPQNAQQYLERALSIDPQDTTAIRMMEDLKKGG